MVDDHTFYEFGTGQKGELTVKTSFNVRGGPGAEKGRSKASAPRDAAIIQLQT